MEIKLNASLDSVARITSAQRPFRPRQTPEIDGFASSHALEAALAKTPDVRAEKLDYARDMIGDPIYPPTEAIQRIATLLAMELESSAKDI